MEKIIERVSKLRREILDGGDYMLPELKRQKLELADEELIRVRRAGDLCIRAFFHAESGKKRNARREEDLSRFGGAIASSREGDMTSLISIENDLSRFRSSVVLPFHWEIEFPEVFERMPGGFDAIIGNPPFLGGTRISEVSGMPYFQWLVSAFVPCEHHCDLIAYFFRQGFNLIRDGGTLGLIATNTIAQGDTREGGLRIILRDRGQIFDATKRLRWPGLAAVIVSVVHVAKGISFLPPQLDGHQVRRISAYLFEGEMDESPVRLAANPYFSLGCKIYGQGFVFDDHDPNCSPLAERNRILAEHPLWSSRILPYIGGEEINSEPAQLPSRYAINFSDVGTENELSEWPELRSIVERLVKPEREELGSNPNNIPLKRRWWAYQAHRPELYKALRDKTRALCLSRVGQALAFAFLPTEMIFSEQVVVFDIAANSGFAVVQSRVHEAWARFLASSMKDDLRYTPSDCFETFPFPTDWETNQTLNAVGIEYYDARADIMLQSREGLTTTYNRFHDSEEKDHAILRLRELHACMDREVLSAYGWNDLLVPCEFIPDYFEEDTNGELVPKGIRFRWPDRIRDELLVRLLKLNAERAEEERLISMPATGQKKKGRKLTKPLKVAKAQLHLGMQTLSGKLHELPSELRLPASQSLLYTINLVVALLSEAGGALPWERLLDAYSLATNPTLMQQLAPSDELSRVKPWGTRWNECVPSGLLIESLNQLGGQNLTVTNDNQGRVFHLLDGPRTPATEDIGYDAWLALRIATEIAPDSLELPERETWTKLAEELVLT